MGAVTEARKRAREELEADIKTGNYAMLSASTGDYNEEENKLRTVQLRKDIREKGFKPYKAYAHTEEWGDEPSVYVRGFPKEATMELGKKYNQMEGIQGGTFYRTTAENYGEVTKEIGESEVLPTTEYPKETHTRIYGKGVVKLKTR